MLQPYLMWPEEEHLPKEVVAYLPKEVVAFLVGSACKSPLLNGPVGCTACTCAEMMEATELEG